MGTSPLFGAQSGLEGVSRWTWLAHQAASASDSLAFVVFHLFYDRVEGRRAAIFKALPRRTYFTPVKEQT